MSTLTATLSVVIMGATFAVALGVVYFAGRDTGWRAGWRAGISDAKKRDARMLARFDGRGSL